MLMEGQKSKIRVARRDPVADRVFAMIADYAEHEPCDVDFETKLNDLRYYGLDSLVMMGVILEIGESFGVRLDELIGAEITTVGDLVSVVKRRRWDSRFDQPGPPANASRSMLHSQETGGRPQSERGLHVRREDIVFCNVDRRRVRIEVTVTNSGGSRSARTQLHLQAAPLGAFLPWRDLTSLWVPPMNPASSVTVNTEVVSPRPRSVGRFDRVPPQRLLTALGMSDDDSRGRQQADQSEAATGGLLSRWLSRRSAATTSPSPALPPDPADLLGRANPHWAGNINVLIGRKAVERHRAQALRIYPGRANVAMLVVGDSRPDEYSFELHGEGAKWNACLARKDLQVRRRGPSPDHELELGAWHMVGDRLIVFVIIEPPEWCAAGELDVHVTRKSTGETAIVEFSLDPAAKGPGCYTL